MDLALQFGHGMMGHARDLIGSWGSGSVVLSPRDLKPPQVEKLSEELNSIGGEVLFDPQCFSRDQDHERLRSHAHWDAFCSVPSDAPRKRSAIQKFIEALAAITRTIGARRYIVPALLAEKVDDDWIGIHKEFISVAKAAIEDRSLLATIPISAQALKSSDDVETIIEVTRKWDVDGYYVVAETPGSYLVDDPVWLGNLLSLTAGLKLQAREVWSGYSNHQMLCLAAAKVDMLVSGTWLNVRSFSSAKFFEPDEDSISRRATWYYCPQALSEFKIPFLDIAREAGVLSTMKSDSGLRSKYADALFGTAMPSTVSWSEREAFRHYLTCLRSQVRQLPVSTFDDAVSALGRRLDSAEKILRRLREEGVFAQDRDFSELIDVSRSALTRLTTARGPILRRKWGSI